MMSRNTISKVVFFPDLALAMIFLTPMNDGRKPAGSAARAVGSGFGCVGA